MSLTEGRQTLPQRARQERVQHNCEQGHVWFVKMYPVSKDWRDPWQYCNPKERCCPVCKAEQTEEEMI